MLIVVAQLVLKLFDRYYLPYFSLRAGDETFWLTSLATYQTNGTIPVTTLAQGPGIFYASARRAALSSDFFLSLGGASDRFRLPVRTPCF